MSVNCNVGEVSEIVISLLVSAPVVTTFCDPKLGLIFVPAIAALASTEALTTALLASLAAVTASSAILAVVTLAFISLSVFTELSAYLSRVTCPAPILAVVTEPVANF